MDHHVAVYREGKSFRVEPGRLLLRHDDTVTLWSVDAGPLTIILPPIIGGEGQVLHLDTKVTRTIPLPIAHGITPRGYEYAVHVDDEHVFAEGGSQPKIIILE